MINFTDDRLYVKGTCNVICEDVNTGDVLYQSNKMSTGNITPSTNLNEIRAGLGNAIAAMIPSDSQLQVDFDAADFSLWAKGAQLGASVTYSAPVPQCQTVTASSASLSIDVSEYVPVPELGQSEAHCYVQEVGAASLLASDGVAYPISAAGVVDGFTATSGKTYKVWFFIQKAAAQKAVISSLIDPKVVRFIAQIAVYSNRGGAASQGTRVGWLYYTIPFLKLQGDATITGDQSNNDTTKISGQAIAYDPDTVSETCSDCDSSTLGYIVYTPDNASGAIAGLAVVGGVVNVAKSTSNTQIPVRLVMKDGSLVAPASYATGFTYAATGLPSGSSVSEAGVVTAGSTTGDGDVTITYTDGEESYTCQAAIHIA
jgi:hypothetical protein